MSFADDLRKPEIKIKNYNWENNRVDQCIGAIKEACLNQKRAGKNYVRGGFYCDDSDYGCYKIVENSNGTPFKNKDGDYEYMKEKLIKEIKKLGFTRFNVSHKVAEIRAANGYTIWGKPKTRGTGIMGHSFYIEIEW